MSARLSSPTVNSNSDRPADDVLVSIVVPCYNVERWLEACLRSILAQTHHRIEVIAVNDRSTDGTGALLDRMAGEDERLRVIHAERNGGPHAARALGVSAAQGEVIGFADSDDRMRPTMVATLLNAMLREQADVAICSVAQEDEQDKPLDDKLRFDAYAVHSEDVLGRFARLEFRSGVLWNKLFRRAVIEGPAQLRLEREVDAGEDHIVCLGAFAKAQRVVVVPDLLYVYRVRGTSISNDRQQGYGFAFLLTCHAACLEALPEEHLQAAADVLYARQYRFEGYRVNDLLHLAPHRERIRQALERLARVRPESAYALVHAFDRSGEPQPTLPLRYHLGAVRRSLAAAWKSLRHHRR